MYTQLLCIINVLIICAINYVSKNASIIYCNVGNNNRHNYFYYLYIFNYFMLLLFCLLIDEPLQTTGCECRGSLNKCHKSCLERWVTHRMTTQCEICHQQFRCDVNNMLENLEEQVTLFTTDHMIVN